MSGHWMPDMPGCLFLGHLTTFQLFGHEGLQCLEVKVLQKWVEANSGWGVVLKSVRLWYMHHDLPKVLATPMVSCGKNTTYMDYISVWISIPTKNRRSSHFWKRQLQDPKPPWNPGWFFQSDYHEGAIQNVVKDIFATLSMNPRIGITSTSGYWHSNIHWNVLAIFGGLSLIPNHPKTWQEIVWGRYDV